MVYTHSVATSSDRMCAFESQSVFHSCGGRRGVSGCVHTDSEPNTTAVPSSADGSQLFWSRLQPDHDGGLCHRGCHGLTVGQVYRIISEFLPTEAGKTLHAIYTFRFVALMTITTTGDALLFELPRCTGPESRD